MKSYPIIKAIKNSSLITHDKVDKNRTLLSEYRANCSELVTAEQASEPPKRTAREAIRSIIEEQSWQLDFSKNTCGKAELACNWILSCGNSTLLKASNAL
jgi:hypothetical protein